jgi:hypothetical protein
MKNTKSIKSPYTTTFTSTSESQTGNLATTDMASTKQDTTSTPSYYLGKYKGIEAFDVCMDFSSDSYNIGVAIAYLLRAGKKPNNPMVNDLKKAIDHINKEIEYIGYDIERAQLKSQATEDDKS